jgi:hypothetical protein
MHSDESASFGLLHEHEAVPGIVSTSMLGGISACSECYGAAYCTIPKGRLQTDVEEEHYDRRRYDSVNIA